MGYYCFVVFMNLRFQPQYFYPKNHRTNCSIATPAARAFGANAGIFCKVYFPRLIVSISTVISNWIKLGIQFLIFRAFYVFYYLKGATVGLNGSVVFFPLLIVLMGILGLGIGMFISFLVTKYRDFSNLIRSGVQLNMSISVS
ncbi:ABC transporter permease [Flavobacterium sp. LS2P90]|uniref:ABC transporter permease n=1 Tax=Flavobacterium xylosi TaxID=3230415 RepID=A0ABW6HTT0_9FLAO